MAALAMLAWGAAGCSFLDWAGLAAGAHDTDPPRSDAALGDAPLDPDGAVAPTADADGRADAPIDEAGSGGDAAASCSSATCAGCCDGTTCRPGTHDSTCGSGGDGCSACTAGTTCASHACVPEALLLFGGFDGLAAQGDTWSFKNGDWSRVTTPTAPPARTGAAMAALGDTVVLFGGTDTTGPRHDTWIWDGLEWKEAAPKTVPAARTEHVMATVGDRIVLFGGRTSGGQDLGDVWLWDGVDWVAAPFGPSARHSAAMTGGENAGFLFGGFGGGGSLGDTWRWDGLAWANVTPVAPAAAPSRRSQHAIARVGANAILFGGASTTMNDTWSFDGAAWSPIAGAGPSARWGGALTPFGGGAIFYGGYDGTVWLSETWKLAAGVWTKLAPPHGPGLRADHAMARFH